MRDLQTSPWKFGLIEAVLEPEYDMENKWFFNSIAATLTAGLWEEDFKSTEKIPFTDQLVEPWRIGYEVTAWYLQHGFNEGEEKWA